MNDQNLREKFEAQNAYGMRNIIAHNYLGVNSRIIKATLEQNFPQLKGAIKLELEK